MDTLLEPGDIFLTRGTGFISKAIRFFSRTIGEKRTKVNHVGVVVESGSLEKAKVVEALSRVKHHRLWDRYGPPKKDSVAIYRQTNLNEHEINIIVNEAESQVGKKYGYFKIFAHLLDWILLGVYIFRRIARNGKYPICSWLVAHAYEKVEKDFGVAAGAVNPDDIWDFIEEHPDIYKEIHPLKRIY